MVSCLEEKLYCKAKNRERMEEVAKSITHQIGGIQNDPLRFVLQGVKSEIVGSHPLQVNHFSYLDQ